MSVNYRNRYNCTDGTENCTLKILIKCSTTVRFFIILLLSYTYTKEIMTCLEAIFLPDRQFIKNSL
jgi:hypothetical protein